MADQKHGREQSGLGQDPFEMFRRLWAPLGVPVPGMTMPTLDPAEVEKRIADLKSVETWLGMNLNMVKMAIQGLEVQKIALTAMKANAGAASDAAKAFASFTRAAASERASKSAADPAAASAHTLANPMLWPWAMMQGAAAPDAAASKGDAPPGTSPAESRLGEGKDGKDRK